MPESGYNNIHIRNKDILLDHVIMNINQKP